MLRNLGTTEILLIALIIIFLFGGRKIPEFVKGLGKAIEEYRKASKDA